MTDKIDIRVLDKVFLENFLERDADDPATVRVRGDVAADDLNQILRGTGLLYNAKDGTVARPGEKPRPLLEEAATIAFIRDADANQDGYVDMKEADTVLRKASLTEEDQQEVDPEGFLNSIDELVKKRYAPIAHNLEVHRANLSFKPIMDYLGTYNRGIMIDQLRHAEETLPLNGLTKSVVNVVGVLPAGLHNVFTSDVNDAPLMVGDAMAATHATNSQYERNQAIERLDALIAEGIKKEEPWALQGDFKAAVGKLSEGDQKVIRDQLAAVKFYEILNIPDDAERNRKLLQFAKAERPGFWGFGYGYTGENGEEWSFSGNSDRGMNLNFWNYTGQVNNLYASRGLLSFLVSKAEVWRPFQGEVTPEMLENSSIKKSGDGKLLLLDLKAGEAIQEDARQTRLAILGTGGNFANAIECRVPGLGIACETWGDEAKMGIPGRVLEMGLSAYLGYRGMKGVGGAWELGRIKGAGQPFKTWWKFGRWYKPFPAGALQEASAAATIEEAEAIKNGTKIAKPRWFGNRAWEAMKSFAYDKIMAKLPALSEGQKAGIAAAASKAPGKGIVLLTDATLVLGIVRATDKRTKAYSNPFKLDYELDLTAPDDPSKPDPILSATKKKAE